jgi:uncharacterized protein (DUF362 family)
MTEPGSSRRDFLKRSSKAGIAVLTAGGLGFWLRSRSEHPQQELSAAGIRDYQVDVTRQIPDMVVASGGSPEGLTEAAMKALGGMETFVSRGDVVVLKPNIGWDRVPQQAANTNPDVVRTVAELCFNAGAKKVVVTDVSCNEPRRCFRRSGIAKEAESVGATVILPEERKFRDIRINGEVLSVWPVFTPIIEADKIINLPILKHHNLARATMAMKNWYGMLGGRRNQLHQNIDVSIADLSTFLRPTLTILDAYRILMTNGPQGGNLEDVKLTKTLIASTDPIAVDAYGATFLNLEADGLPFITIGHDRGIGNKNYQELNIERVDVT